MNIKELKRIIRNDFNLYIRDLVIKDTCEKCNTKENLEVHHTYPLSLMIQETLNAISIDAEDKHENKVVDGRKN